MNFHEQERSWHFSSFSATKSRTGRANGCTAVGDSTAGVCSRAVSVQMIEKIERLLAVVGVTAPRYCVFGSTVTLAAKMENSGQPDKIQMTLKSHQLLTERFPEFKCSPRGGVRLEVGRTRFLVVDCLLQGVGTLLTYFLDERDDALASGRSNSQVPSDPDEEHENEAKGIESSTL